MASTYLNALKGGKTFNELRENCIYLLSQCNKAGLLTLVSPDSTRWEAAIEKRQNKNELANASQSIKTARDVHL